MTLVLLLGLVQSAGQTCTTVANTCLTNATVLAVVHGVKSFDECCAGTYLHPSILTPKICLRSCAAAAVRCGS